MNRILHSYFGIFAAFIISVMAISGAVLSIEPALERQAVTINQLSVAEIASITQKALVGVSLIKRSANGQITAEDGMGEQYVINLTTAQAVPVTQRHGLFSIMARLHRSFFLAGNGKIASALSAISMLVLSISGIILVARRQGVKTGGWIKFFSPVQGTKSQKIHIELGRYGSLFCLLIAVTGIYLSLVGFEILPSDSPVSIFPEQVTGLPPVAVDQLAALQNLDVADFRSLMFPYPDDLSDAFLLETSSGTGYIDQASGALLNFQPASFGQTAYEFFYMLHSGQGLWWLGILLGIVALTIPALTITSVVMWLKQAIKTAKIKDNFPIKKADTLILVGSENGTTWDFAKTLRHQLLIEGARVHLADMNSFGKHMAHATSFYFLVSTYGDGQAPASAHKALGKLAQFEPRDDQYACVLGFGDTRYANYCGFAKTIEAQLIQNKWQLMLALQKIDRQSVQSFYKWGQALGLDLQHQPKAKTTSPIELVSVTSYGEQVQSPIKILRFKAPATGGTLPKFYAGDIVGITPPSGSGRNRAGLGYAGAGAGAGDGDGGSLPRLYSLASSSQDGFLEICVTKQRGGLCSGYLHQLEKGAVLDVFIRPNPDFRLDQLNKPHILIGAGTGIAPFMGFIRGNSDRKPLHLYWGGRHRQSDFIGEEFLHNALSKGHLARLSTAFSRQGSGQYVQDRMLQDAAPLRQLILDGAKVMICGGTGMATGVRAALETILETTDLNISSLKQAGQYVEDVY